MACFLSSYDAFSIDVGGSILNKRIFINQVEPNAYKAMFGLELYLGDGQLESRLKSLIKIRASQLNGCAYCIQMHTETAMERGETLTRLFAISAWNESPLFSDVERAILRLTEEITLISKNGLSEDTYKKSLRVLGEKRLAQAIMQIVTINAWNRIAVATGLVHE